MSAPLAGVRVLDLTHFVAGPWCTMMLADLGASVIKVEPVGTGEIGRQMGGVYDGGHSAIFLAFNRNKRSVAIDLKGPGSREIVSRLVADVDVVVHNFRPGAAERLGLGADDLLRRRPDLIYCAITAFGTGGPYASHPANDPIIQGLAGSMRPGPSGKPVRLGVSLPDFAAAAMGTIGILGALLRRQRTGVGGLVETNLLEGQLYAQADLLQAPLLGTSGADAAGAAFEAPVFSCAGGQHLLVDLASTADVYRAAAALKIGVEERGDVLVVHRAIADQLAALSRADAVALFAKHGVASTEVMSLADGMAAGRQLVRRLAHPEGGTMSVLTIPVSSEPSWPERLLPPPRLGQHTREVLLEIGMSGNEVRRLEIESVAQCEATVASRI